jgi:hypothetical protein
MPPLLTVMPASASAENTSAENRKTSAIRDKNPFFMKNHPYRIFAVS